MSYINSLNLLGIESAADISEEALTEELSLWANAQFTFDTTPGSALLDDLSKDPNKPSSEADLFATLTELGHHHSHHHHHQTSQQQPSFLSTPLTLTPSTSVVSSPSYIIPLQQQQQQQQHGLPRLAPAPTPLDTSMPWSSAAPASIANTAVSSISSNTSSASSRKRKPSSSTESSGSDFSEKVFAEEDKRRRNTAASARFRMKKKMREQVLEETAKEMTAKAEALEKQVKELEMEAKWLRALVVEKDPKLLERPQQSSSS